MAKYLDDQGLRHFWQLLKQMLTGKVDKVEGKGLSANDFTDAYRSKLDGIGDGANQYVHPSHTANTGKPITNQTPGFGETFTISQISNDNLGHVTGQTDRTVKIPGNAMAGATASKAGKTGLVPEPQAGDQNKFLNGKGEWATVVTQDKNVEVVLSRTKKAYLLGTTTEPTSTAASTTAVADTGVYLDVDAGSLVASKFSGTGTGLTALDAGNISRGTIDSARLPAASATAQGAMSANDKKKLDAFGSADTYALKSEITSVYRHKGSVQSETDLPKSNNTVGDVYNVIDTGMNYVFLGNSKWDALGSIFSVDPIPNRDIDTILNS